MKNEKFQGQDYWTLHRAPSSGTIKIKISFKKLKETTNTLNIPVV